MADKTVNELPRASTVTTADLFVLEQAGQAKSLTGQVLINDLAAALDGHGGISDITLNADYTLTITLADETQVTTTSIRGATGAKGDKGTDGRAITSVTKTNTSGLVDTYKIQFSDNTSTNFTVTNGSSIKSIAKTATSGLTDTYTVTLTDNTKSTFTVTNGNGIASVTLQSGTHAAGTTDTYKITFDNGQYTTFSVYNGQNGSGAVSTVCSKAPDATGNVALSADDVGARADTWTPTAEDVGARPSTWTPTAADVGAIPNTDAAVTGDKIAVGAVSRRYSVTIPTSPWARYNSDSANAWYTDITVSGVKSTDRGDLFLQRGISSDATPSLAAFEQDAENFAHIVAANITADNTLRVFADEIPANNIYCYLRVVKK